MHAKHKITALFAGLTVCAAMALPLTVSIELVFIGFLKAVLHIVKTNDIK